MKKLIGVAVVAVSMFLVSFQVTGSIDDIISAMRIGNASRLSEYFDARVDLSLPGRSDNYSRSQAELIMKDFFQSHKVKSFDIKHRGANTDGSLFCVGTLETSLGSYRAKLFMKNKSGDQVLQEIGFELVQ